MGKTWLVYFLVLVTSCGLKPTGAANKSALSSATTGGTTTGGLTGDTLSVAFVDSSGDGKISKGESFTITVSGGSGNYSAAISPPNLLSKTSSIAGASGTIVYTYKLNSDAAVINNQQIIMGWSDTEEALYQELSLPVYVAGQTRSLSIALDGVTSNSADAPALKVTVSDSFVTGDTISIYPADACAGSAIMTVSASNGAIVKSGILPAQTAGTTATYSAKLNQAALCTVNSVQYARTAEAATRTLQIALADGTTATGAGNPNFKVGVLGGDFVAGDHIKIYADAAGAAACSGTQVEDYTIPAASNQLPSVPSTVANGAFNYSAKLLNAGICTTVPVAYTKLARSISLALDASVTTPSPADPIFKVTAANGNFLSTEKISFYANAACAGPVILAVPATAGATTAAIKITSQVINTTINYSAHVHLAAATPSATDLCTDAFTYQKTSMPATVSNVDAYQDQNFTFDPARPAGAGENWTADVNLTGLETAALDSNTGKVTGSAFVRDRIAIDKVLPDISLMLLSGTTISKLISLKVRQLGDPFTRDSWAIHTFNIDPNKNYGFAYYHADVIDVPTADQSIRLNSTLDATLAGYYGDGVLVSVSDSGVDWIHEDLSANYDKAHSRNYMLSSPLNNDPNYHVAGTTMDSEMAHGTAVTGLIAAAGWNDLGARGVAPKAKWAADNLLANGNTYNKGLLDHLGVDGVDIVNQSFGGYQNILYPEDDLASGDGLYLAAMQDAAESGRNGLGRIISKAAGNEHMQRRNPNFDIDSSNPFVINVGALDAKGEVTEYSDESSALWITTPGGSIGKDSEITGIPTNSYPGIYLPGLMTTDISGCDEGFSRSPAADAFSNLFDAGQAIPKSGNAILNPNCNYTSQFAGTSAAAPVFSGLAAVLLSAAKSKGINLSARDVKYIFAKTAIPLHSDMPDSRTGAGNLCEADLLGVCPDAPTPIVALKADAPNYIRTRAWVKNKAGFNYQNLYGFGAANIGGALKMVTTPGWTSPFSGPLVSDSTTSVQVTAANTTYTVGATTNKALTADKNGVITPITIPQRSTTVTANGVPLDIDVTVALANDIRIEAVQVVLNAGTIGYNPLAAVASAGLTDTDGNDASYIDKNYTVSTALTGVVPSVGELGIELFSPDNAGTRTVSTLLETNNSLLLGNYFLSKAGKQVRVTSNTLGGVKLLSNAFYQETANGKWRIRLIDGYGGGAAMKFYGAKLIFWGTKL